MSLITSHGWKVSGEGNLHPCPDNHDGGKTGPEVLSGSQQNRSAAPDNGVQHLGQEDPESRRAAPGGMLLGTFWINLDLHCCLPHSEDRTCLAERN